MPPSAPSTRPCTAAQTARAERAVLLSEGRLSLNPASAGRCLEPGATDRRLDGLLRQPGPVERRPGRHTRTATRLLGLYRGPFLGHDQTHRGPAPRASACMRGCCARCRASPLLRAATDWRRAADTYERAVDVNELPRRATSG